MSMESLYEYGARAGLWRILRLFEARRLPLTIFGVARALQRHPDALAAYRELGYEIACHGLRWISYQLIDEATERAHMAEAVAVLRELTGSAPLGWYTGRDSPNTRRLVVEHGGFLYDADSYADDLPYWTHVASGERNIAHLVIPLHAGHQRHALRRRAGLQLRHAVLRVPARRPSTRYTRKGDPAGLDRPKMLSIGLHARIVGRPARIVALQRFLDHVQSHDKVWICRRVDIARHWIAHHPPGQVPLPT